MPMYQVLDTVEQVKAVWNSPVWVVFARFGDRQDWPIYNETGVRMHDGVLQVNAGEYHFERGYLNEEWLKPEFVYMKHQCDGCHYPPNMCCLQPSSFRSYRNDEWDPDEDDLIMSSDAYIGAEAALGAWPTGVEPRRIEAPAQDGEVH